MCTHLPSLNYLVRLHLDLLSRGEQLSLAMTFVQNYFLSFWSKLKF